MLPRPALAAADTQVLVRETIRGVAARCGLVASLAPKPWPDQAGNGAHVHFSAWQDERNVFHDPAGRYGLSALAEQFVAGILAHTPGLLALTAPSFNSYARLLPQHWSSAFVCWGPDNREATVRVPSTFWGDEAASTNLEYKPADASANPYLAFGGLIAAGLDGIERQLVPPPPIDIDPADLSDAARDDSGHRAVPDHAGRCARRARSRRRSCSARWAIRWPVRTSPCAGRSRRRTPRRPRSSPSPTTSRSTDVAAVDGLRRAIAEIAAIDQHAHLLDHADAAPALHDVLSESRDPAQRRARSPAARLPLALRELGAVLGVEPSESALTAARQADGYIARLLGRLPSRRDVRRRRVPVGRHDVARRARRDRPVHRAPGRAHRERGRSGVRRVAAIPGVPVRLPAGDQPTARATGAVGLKTIAAYRCGLDLPAPSLAAAVDAYEAWRRSGSSRLTDAALVSFFVADALEAAGPGVPLQVHTGLGDADQSLLGADPALLQPQLDHGFLAGVPVVLLHCYPFVRHAGYLASIYRDVHVDLSLALTFVPQRGSALVGEALELTPASKLLFATDASRLPEMYRLGRTMVARVAGPRSRSNSSTTTSWTSRSRSTGRSRSWPATPGGSTRCERGLRFTDRPCRVDETDVAERLGEVAEQLAGGRVDLLGEQADVVGEGGRPLEHLAGAGRLSGQRERLGEPERAQQERALVALEPVVGEVAVDEAVLVGEAIGDGVDRRQHTRIGRPAGSRRSAS